MKVNNGQIWVALKPPENALQTLLKEPWPVKTAYYLAKLARELRGHYGDIEAVRTKLILQYGQTNEKGDTEVIQGTEGWEHFAAEFNELLAQEAEVTTIDKPIVLPDRDIDVTPNILLALEGFVEME